MQSSVAITRANIVRYYINNYRNWARISIRCWIHKRHPITRPNGRAMECLLENLWENWPRFNDAALHLQKNRIVKVIIIVLMGFGLKKARDNIWCHRRSGNLDHYNNVIMGAMVSQITSHTIVYSIVYSGAYQRKHQSSASLAFVRGIQQWPVNSPHKWPVIRKMFPLDDVIISYHITLHRIITLRHIISLLPCTGIIWPQRDQNINNHLLTVLWRLKRGLYIVYGYRELICGYHGSNKPLSRGNNITENSEASKPKLS